MKKKSKPDGFMGLLHSEKKQITFSLQNGVNYVPVEPPTAKDMLRVNS